MPQAFILLTIAVLGVVANRFFIAAVPSTDITLCIVGANICAAIANKR